MSTTVEFHILASSDLSALDRYVCALLGEWVAGGQTVCVVTDDLACAERVDTALWTFSEQSFIAHEIATTADAKIGPPPLPPVLITIGRTFAADILVNLGTSAPAGVESFTRVVECIDADPTRRDAGRRRFVVYRDRGFPPETLKVGS
jgi:DNA polymerase-3 subunit chi